MSSAGIYVHIPFCRGKCPYCDFYSRVGSAHDLDCYTAALCHAIETAPALAADTLYLGGGTPSLLGARRLIAIRNAAAQRFSLSTDAEVTLEVNPGDASPGFWQETHQAGFTRASVGVQALQDELLQTLGRRHTAKQASDALLQAAGAGFEHLSADMMLALPGQTEHDIRETVNALAALPIDHVSAYLLELVPGTLFAKRYAEPDEDFFARCYLTAAQALEQNGFAQYEISSFARGPAGQSRHNLKYWHCSETLGIGPAAHSFVHGQRFYFPKDRAAFCTAPDPWSLVISDGTGGDESERAMLLLRLAEGVGAHDVPGLWQDMIAHAQPLLHAGLLRQNKERLALTPKGCLVSNSVIGALLA